MKQLSIGSDGTLSIPSSLLSDATEVLLFEGADAIVIKKVRRSVAEKSFEEVALPFRRMARDLGVTPEQAPSLVAEARHGEASATEKPS